MIGGYLFPFLNTSQKVRIIKVSFSMALISGQTGEMLFIEDGHFYYLMKNLVLTSL